MPFRICPKQVYSRLTIFDLARVADLLLYRQLSLSSILLLYSVSIIYMDILRLPREAATGSYSEAIRTADGLLEHYDHPAARVARVGQIRLIGNDEAMQRLMKSQQLMCKDILNNHFDQSLRS